MTRLFAGASSIALGLALFTACAITPQAKYDRYLARGRAELEKRDYSRAILEFRNAATVMPKEAEPNFQLGVASQANGDIVGAVIFYKKALEKNPKHPGAELRLAQLMALTLDKKTVEDAKSRLESLKESPSASSEASEVLNALAFVELKLGKTQEAVDDLNQLLARVPRNLGSSIMLAQTKAAQGDTKGAEEILKQACQADPNSPQPHIAFGDFYVAQKMTANAEAEFQRALAINPKSGAAVMGLANLQRSLGRGQEAEANYKRLAGSGEERYRYVYAEFLFEDGRKNEAVSEFERINKAFSDDRRARTQLIAAYRAVNRPADAQRVLDEALKKNPKDLDALLQRAEMALAANQYFQAEADLTRVLVLRPNAAEAHYVFARLHAARGEMLSYREQLSEALRLNGDLLSIRVELAGSLTADNKASAALALLDAAPSVQKGMTDLVVARNWALWGTGDLAGMRKGIDQGLARERSSDLLIQDGIWKLRTGNPTGARTALQEALKMNPTDLRAISALSKSYAAQKQDALALQTVQEYASREPGSAPIQQLLGNMLLARGDRVKARASFAAAKTADPNYLDADFSLTQLDVLEGKPENAQKRLDTFISAHPGNETASLWLGNLALSQGKNEDAITRFTQVLQINPNNTQAMNNLAYLLIEYRKQPDVALKYAQRAVELAPDDSNLLDTLGWVLYQKGLYPSAIQYLERAAADKRNPVSGYHLAMAYAKSGDTAKGRTTLRAALKVNPKLPEADAAEQLLGKSH